MIWHSQAVVIHRLAESRLAQERVWFTAAFYQSDPPVPQSGQVLDGQATALDIIGGDVDSTFCRQAVIDQNEGDLITLQLRLQRPQRNLRRSDNNHPGQALFYASPGDFVNILPHRMMQQFNKVTVGTGLRQYPF
jgi:hypothetical protein